jgi:pantoate--beta-alanine ligase
MMLSPGTGVQHFANLVSTPGALLIAALHGGLRKDRLLDAMPRVGELPFDSTRKRMTTVHPRPAPHDGHAALIDAARSRAGRGGTVIVSIFVNPTQFAPHEDLAKYPRPFDADLSLCTAHQADAVFAPSVPEVYPPGDSTFVEETVLSRGLCGARRPGHFRGVCTVVAKLFHLTRPDAAIFGEKDFQQLAVIRRMTRDLFPGLEIIGHPTVRETSIASPSASRP